MCDASLEHLVGERKQVCRKLRSDCFCGFEIEYKLQFGRPLHRQVAGFSAPQNLPGVDAYLTESIRDARSIIHEAASRRKFAPGIHGRHLVTCGESDKLINVVAKQRIDANLEGLNSVAYKRRKSIFYLD